MVRELPGRVDERVRCASRRSQARGLQRFHPKMLEDLLFRASTSVGKRSNGAGLLVLLSFARDDSPWLYELGMEIYRAMRIEDRPGVVEAHKQFEAAMEVMMHGPWGRELFRDEEDSYISFRFLPELVDRTVHDYLASMPLKRRSTKTSEPPPDATQV